MLLRRAHLLVLGQLCRLFAPAVASAGILLLVRKLGLCALPLWLISLAALVAIPVFHIGRAKLQYWQHARKAAQMGAAMPPKWEGKLIGSWDILQLLDDAYFNGYLSKHALCDAVASETDPSFLQVIIWPRSSTNWDQHIIYASYGITTTAPLTRISSRYLWIAT